MKKRQTKLVLKENILLFILALFIVGLIISGFKIYNWNKDRKNTLIQVNNLNDLASVNEINDEGSKTLNEDTISSNDPYWEYIKMKMIDVDFNSLKSINKDVKGWIKVNGTNINYPFVQSNDNSYYLKHSFDKKYNQAGWVFLDYRNTINELNNNTIIYAHARVDSTMFGTLKNILTSKWQNNKDNHIVKISTAKQNTLWQVFSVYTIKTTSDYLYTKFSDDSKYDEFLSLLINRSIYKFNTTVNSSDKILTLSSCYNKTNKVVLHAKLIKISNK